MTRPFLRIALFFALACLPSAADEPLTAEQLKRLEKQGPKIYLPVLIDLTKAKLERVYQARLKDASPKYRDALEKAQKAWLAYCDADLAVEILESEGGSGQAASFMERRLYHLRLRIYQLSTPFGAGWVGAPEVPEPAPK